MDDDINGRDYMGKPFIILSHHRSGSNFLNELVQQHPKFSTINEPLSMHTNFFRENDLVPWTATEYNEDFLHDSLKGNEQLINFLKELRYWLCNPFETHTRGIKETLLFEKLQWLKRFIANIRVIFLIRDPRSVVTSIMRRNMHDSIWKYSTTIPKYMEQASGPLKRNWDVSDLSIFSWKIRYELAKENCNLFEHLFIRLEDVMQQPKETISKIMLFLDSDLCQTQLDFLYESNIKTRGKTFSSYRATNEIINLWRERLPLEIRKNIESILNREMEELGYL